MSSRIIFEEEISEVNLDKANTSVLNKNITIKQEQPTAEDNRSQDINNLGNGKQNEILHNSSNKTQTVEETIMETNNEISDSNNCDNNIGERENNIENISNPIQENTSNNSPIETVQCTNANNNNVDADKCYEVPIEQNGNVCPSPSSMEQGTKVKAKKKPSELELLGVDIKKLDEELDSKYDVYGDDNKIFRRYKLRKTEHQISYKEPANWPLKRRVSSDVEEPISLVCPVCEYGFDSKRALQIHVRYHNNTVTEYTCSICSDKFVKNADLIAHKSTHTSESFVCEQCKLAFSDHCDFQLHNVIHTSTPHIKCPECGLLYPRSSYKNHILTHFDKKLTCPICSYATNGEYNLRSHINLHKSRHTCVECGKTLKDKKYFEYHMSLHTGVKKFQCLYCGKCFGTQGMRLVHSRVHTGEKPYFCDICGHRAARSGDIKRHKLSHETEKKVSCEVCSKKFLHKESLMLHMRSHTRKGLYECPVCNQKLITPTGLKVHILFKHTNERPVGCTFCNRKFINNNQYRKHTRSKVHKRNVYGHTIQKNISDCSQ